ncbi:TetR/AcrR family transcriptional regulator [Sphingomonas sp.]|uniref:TetR/AcrR family transcriptional regulator n=1 Tax=Sphingomonas sp. TaxID=28214 RepID=UPI0038B07D3D
MGETAEDHVRPSAGDGSKTPRTARGERTLRKILDAAREEFGERGFSDTSIVGITQRAGVALGTFYTYFESKEALFQALVRDMSAQVRDAAAPAFTEPVHALDAARRGLELFLQFARKNRHIYRIIDEAEFVDPATYREHYETTVTRITARLIAARGKGEIAADLSDDDLEILAWASMGANVFLGLRYSVWDSADPASVAAVANRLFRKGIAA